MYASKAQAADAKIRAQKRSRLIAEMARDLGRNEDSIASSTGSNHGTVSPDSTLDSIHQDLPQNLRRSNQLDGFDESDSMSFHPERDEVINSTGQFNASYSHKLPELRDTAKKYGRWAPRPAQASYVIDTSAIGRAFPDFSGGVSSDDDLSREIGRGNTVRTTNELSIKYTENPGHPDSPIVTLDNVQVLYTPTKGHLANVRSTPLQDALRNNMNKHNASANNSFNVERKETISTQYNQRRISKSVDTIEIEQKQAPFNHFNKRHTVPSESFDTEYKENVPPKANSGSPYTSNASRIINGKRRPLHARVADEFDDTRSSTQSHPLAPRTQAARAEHPFASPQSTNHPREASFASTRSNGTVLRNTESAAYSESAHVRKDSRNDVQLQNARYNSARQQSAVLPSPQQPSSVRSQKPKMQSKAQTPTHLTPNPTMISFVAPPLHLSSGKNTETFDLGIPVAIREGKVQTRQPLSKLGPTHGPIDGFELPDDEEDIYLMCEVQKVRISQLEEERATFVRRIRELELENAQAKQEHSKSKSEMKVWENHKCANQELENLYTQAQNDHAQLLNQHNQLKKETYQLRMEKKSWENHQCVDEKLELELAQMNLEKAQFRVQQKSWDAHRCIDKTLEREVIELKNEKKAWEAHQCSDENLEMEVAYLRKQKKGWESHECVDESLEREVARLKNQKKAWDSHQCSDNRLQEENDKLKGTLMRLEAKQHNMEDLETQNAQLQSEKRDWEAHRCTHSARGESGGEKGSLRYKQLMVEKTRVEEKFTTLKSRYEILEKTSSHAKVRTDRVEEESSAFRKENDLLKNQMDEMRVELQEQNREIERLSHKRSASRGSVMSRKSRKDDDMTSAFILPDIVSGHEENITEGITEGNTEGITEGITGGITGSVKVNDVHDAIYPGDEPTLRPSMGRAEALAKTMGMIRDDIAHLKAKLREAEKAYQKHEGSMGKRERLRMEKAINKLIEEISNKSDELYYLHDVELAHEAEDAEEEGNDTELSLPWEGVEDTN